MVDQGSRERAETWRPWGAAGSRPVLAWPEGLAGFVNTAARRLRAWALADVGPGRLVPWLAVGFGLGIVLYFTAEREPDISLSLRCSAVRFLSWGV
jgi:competence protein ComEC